MDELYESTSVLRLKIVYLCFTNYFLVFPTFFGLLRKRSVCKWLKAYVNQVICRERKEKFSLNYSNILSLTKRENCKNSMKNTSELRLIS